MASLDDLRTLFSNSKFEEIVEETRQIPIEERTIHVTNIIARSFRKLGRYDEAMSLLESVQIAKHDPLISKISHLSTVLDVLTHMGKYEDGKEIISDLDLLLQKINLSKLTNLEKREIAQTHNELARIYFFLADFSDAIENLEHELEIARELDDRQKITSSLQNIGATYTSTGNYVQALDYLEKALGMAYAIDSTHLIGHIEDNIGLVYFYQGRLEEALERITKSLEIHQQTKDPRGMGFNYEYIGSINLKLNNIFEALVNFEQSYVIRKELGNDTHTASTIFAIVTAFLEIGERDNASAYLEELKTISTRTKTRRIEMQYQLATAIYLKESKLFRNIAKAETILKQVVEVPEITDFYYTTLAYLHLIDILYDQISQLELSDTEEISEDIAELFTEIETYTEEIGSIATTKNLPDLKVSYYNLKGFITISRFEAEKAYHYFNQAEEICRDYNLTNMRFQFKDKEQPSQDQALVMNKEAFPHKIQTSLNKIIHSLPRLLIVTSLLKNIELTFTELVDLTRMSPGNLGKHCDKLVEIGYLLKSKKLVDDKFLTVYSLTTEGLSEFNRYTGILIPFLTSAQNN